MHLVEIIIITGFTWFVLWNTLNLFVLANKSGSKQKNQEVNVTRWKIHRDSKKKLNLACNYIPEDQGKLFILKSHKILD